MLFGVICVDYTDARLAQRPLERDYVALHTMYSMLNDDHKEYVYKAAWKA